MLKMGKSTRNQRKEVLNEMLTSLNRTLQRSSDHAVLQMLTGLLTDVNRIITHSESLEARIEELEAEVKGTREDG